MFDFPDAAAQKRSSDTDPADEPGVAEGLVSARPRNGDSQAPRIDARLRQQPGLVAVGSHESEFVRDGGQVVTSTYLECAAVRTDHQGAALPEVELLDDDGRPVTLGALPLEVLLSDISERQRVPIVRGVVARENTRSLPLCTRIGLTDERDDPDQRFVQRLGRIATWPAIALPAAPDLASRAPAG